MTQKTAHDFMFQTLTGEIPLPLSQFEGKVLFIVNTASACGYTPQYAELESLYQTYKDKGLVVLGVPSNDFAGQEPGSSEEIASFCQLNYGVSFPMTAKEHVRGKDAHPFYRWAKEVLGFGTAPKWNFHKYLVGRDGTLVDYFVTPTSPTSERVVRKVEEALGAHDHS